MNSMKGMITSCESSGGISLVEIAVGDDTFSALVLDPPESANQFAGGTEITMLFKETEVSLGKNLSGEISMRNRFPSKITQIEFGAVLTKVHLIFKQHPLVSIITSRSARKMNLAVGDEVVGLVKSNEITLMQH